MTRIQILQAALRTIAADDPDALALRAFIRGGGRIEIDGERFDFPDHPTRTRPTALTVHVAGGCANSALTVVEP